MLSVTWAFGPPMNMKVPPACHSEDRHEPRLTTVHENARSAVECGSLLPLSLRPACWPWKGIPCLWRARPRASSWDQSGSKLPHSKAPAALNSCVFNQGFAYFHDSEESAPYLLLAKQIPRRFAQDDRNQTLLRSLLNTLQGFEEQ